MISHDTAARVPELVVDSERRKITGPAGTEELFRLLYAELRTLAGFQMRREREGHTLQPTALVHEAFLKLIDQDRVSWKGKTHFLAVSAKVMCQLLIDHARRKGMAKRGGDRQRVVLAEDALIAPRNDLAPEELLDLDAALDRLAAQDPWQARIVELRLYAGLTVPEVAHVLGISQRTVEGDSTHARAWLRRDLEQRPAR